MWLTKGNIDLTVVQEAHWKIIEALEQGKGEQAGKLLRMHIFNFPASNPMTPVTFG